MAEATRFMDFADHWSAFLSAWKGIYTALEQGAKVSPQSRQWFGGKKAERIRDPLLQYLFEARNADEHGLEPPIEEGYEGPLVAIKDLGDPNAKIRMQHRTVNGKFEMRFIDSDGNPIEPVREGTSMGVLATVSARGGREYGPPIRHLDQLLDDISALGAAKAGMQYAIGLVEEARQRS